MSFVQGLATHGGDGDAKIASKAQVTINNIQYLSSHGHEAVSDATSKTKVEYEAGHVHLSPIEVSKQKGTVYLPIHNPPGGSNPALLERILFQFDHINDASIASATLYYDSTQVVRIQLGNDSTATTIFNEEEAGKYAYRYLSGISLQLDLKFPNQTSAIKLYSVTLVYKLD